MSKLNIGIYDYQRVMGQMAELIEDVLGRPISEIEQPEKLIDDARRVIHQMRDAASVANPVSINS